MDNQEKNKPVVTFSLESRPVVPTQREAGIRLFSILTKRAQSSLNISNESKQVAKTRKQARSAPGGTA